MFLVSLSLGRMGLDWSTLTEHTQHRLQHAILKHVHSMNILMINNVFLGVINSGAKHAELCEELQALIPNLLLRKLDKVSGDELSCTTYT